MNSGAQPANDDDWRCAVRACRTPTCTFGDLIKVNSMKHLFVLDLIQARLGVATIREIWQTRPAQTVAPVGR